MDKKKNSQRTKKREEKKQQTLPNKENKKTNQLEGNVKKDLLKLKQNVIGQSKSKISLQNVLCAI